MSHRRISNRVWSANLREDRISVARPSMFWAFERDWRDGGAWVCRTAERQYHGAVFADGRHVIAVASPDTGSLNSFTVPGSWPCSPIGLRNAKVATEAFIAAHGLLLAEAA
jgi:hypothetical protein